jgi:hypothetical protein
MTQYDPNDLKRRQLTLSQLGLGGYQGGQHTQGGQIAVQDGWQGDRARQKPPLGGWPPRIFQPQHPIKDPFGLQGFGEQVTGFGETLGGYGEQMGGFGEQLGGFGEQLGGFRDEFSNINNRLQSMEQGIASLTDKLGVQQQPQNPFQGLSSMFFSGGYGNPYMGYSYF